MNLNRTILLIVWLAAMSLTAVAQEEVADEKYYNDLYSKLYKSYSKNPDDVESMILLANFYADSINPLRNYAMAMKMISSAEKQYIVLLEDRDLTKEVRKLMRKGITMVGVRKRKREIIEKTRNMLDSNEPISEKNLESLAESFQNDPYTMRYIEQRRIKYKYDKTKKDNNLESYKKFIDTYSATQEGEDALKMMTSLAAKKVESAQTEAQVDATLAAYYNYPTIQNVAFRRKSKIAYNNLSKNPTPEACRAYLSKYPGSDDYSKVLAKLETISEEEFTTLSSPRQLANFVLNNPDNPLSDQATEQLKKMILDEHNMEALDIYLKEFKLDYDYNNIWLEYFKWHTYEGNKSPISRFKILYPDFPYVRALEEAEEIAAKMDTVNIFTPFTEKDFGAWSSKIYHLTGKKISYVALLRTLQPLIAAKDWKKALARIDYFNLSFEDNCVEEVAELRSILEAPQNQKMELVPIVRPNYDFMHPIMMPDGNHILYNRNVNGHIEIHCAIKSKKKNGYIWRGTGALSFTNFINNGLQIFNLYDNGNKMLLGYRGNIMIAHRNDSTWTVTETLPSPVNSHSNDFDAFMLPDGSGILFASDRSGGMNLQPTKSIFHGDTNYASDIWYAPKTAKGWGTPINLGKDINSPYMERCPLISNDLKTIFFITDGRGGLGYGDIYYATRDNIDDWTHWSKPVNCGKEVNTGYDEASISFSHNNNNTIIIGSNSNGHYGCFSVSTPNSIKSNLVKVKINPDSNDMTITLIDVSTQKELFSDQVIEGGKAWSTTLDGNKSFLLFTEYENLFLPGMLFVPTSRRVLDPIGYDVSALTSMSKEGQALLIPSFIFENNRAVPLQSTIVEAKHLANFLNNNPKLTLEINSHVEGSDDEFCYNLSQDRAQEIKRLLTTQGVNPDRITISPYGNSITKRGYVKSSTTLLFRTK